MSKRKKLERICKLMVVLIVWMSSASAMLNLEFFLEILVCRNMEPENCGGSVFSFMKRNLGGANPAEPPIALQLTYKRDIPGAKIVNASVDHMRELGASEQQLANWGPAMTRIFPNVKPGDQIVGIYRPGTAIFMYNNREIGQINDAEFARLFFGIWLDPRTTEPKLRNSLLQVGAG